MITRLDISKFGLFDHFEWKHDLGNTNFEKLNVIYGRNYSGKTTLSRIFRCLETKEIHPQYTDAHFALSLNNGAEIMANSIAAIPDAVKVRVYNTDFIKSNLSWLHQDDGTIEPFTLLGSPNIALEAQIKAIDDALGNVEHKHGLLYQQAEKTNVFSLKDTQLTQQKSTLDEKLKAEAQAIRKDAAIYNQTTYIITQIRRDISNASSDKVLSIDLLESHKKLLKEEPKPDLKKLPESKPKFPELLEQTNALLTTKVQPSKSINDLLNDKLLQEWVRQGIEQHKDKRTSCGFCGNPIPNDLWETLGAHFSQESEALREVIHLKISELTNYKNKVSSYSLSSKDGFYARSHTRFSELIDLWNELRGVYAQNLDSLIQALHARETDIFTTHSTIEINDVSEKIVDLFRQFNQLIEANNLKTTTLKKEQDQARIDLRLHRVAEFLLKIGYAEKQKEISDLEADVAQLKQAKDAVEREIGQLIEDKRQLKAQAKDESKGAELVNQYLIHFFGHNGLKLVAEGEHPATKFKVLRGTQDASNLSEGECSLIAFCYFIAKMEDELQNNNLIIYIDDPISSLDSNHIFFMFSLIDSVIAKTQKYEQLFISTHNLDFLRYLKRLTKPKNSKIGHFLIERHQKQNAIDSVRSCLVNMPEHIRSYSTEFNYLFGQIYTTCNTNEADLSKTYSQLYNLPNNIRKFLEFYLFFKYPNNTEPLKNLDKLFGEHTPSLINRIINENSHLTQIDRGWKPMEEIIDETRSCAQLVLDKIKEIDPDQFAALVESIQK